MPNETTAAQLAKELASNENILEAYVLVREVKILLQFDDADFQPTIRVKIYTNIPGVTHPYYFEVSHAVRTPISGAYMPNPGVYSEEQAVSTAVSAISRMVNDAIRAGHEPNDSWLKPVSDF